MKVVLSSRLYLLPLLCMVLPIVAIHGSLFISVAFDLFDPCIPYWSDCVSISKAGRGEPASLFFKGLMIPYAVTVMVLWYFCGEWLRTIGARRARSRWLQALGITAALFLILYVVALGVQGDEYRLMRKIGVVLAFSFTFVAQLLLYRTVRKLRTASLVSERTLRLQWQIAVALLTMGVTSVLLDAFYPDYPRWENAFEWWMALLLYSWFFTVYRAWNETGFRIRFVSDQDVDTAVNVRR